MQLEERDPHNCVPRKVQCNRTFPSRCNSESNLGINPWTIRAPSSARANQCSWQSIMRSVCEKPFVADRKLIENQEVLWCASGCIELEDAFKWSSKFLSFTVVVDSDDPKPPINCGPSQDCELSSSLDSSPLTSAGAPLAAAAPYPESCVRCECRPLQSSSSSC